MHFHPIFTPLNLPLFEQSSDRQSCRQTAVPALSLPLPLRDNHNYQVSHSSKQQTRQQRPLYEPPKRHPLVLPNLPDRPPGSLPRYRPPYTMDAYPGYRESSSARSPPERTSWNGRDEGYRASERVENARTDTFYRGRSPGRSMFRLSRDIFLCALSHLPLRYLRMQGGVSMSHICLLHTT